jgi:AcrR family transcriptional regulator
MTTETSPRATRGGGQPPRARGDGGVRGDGQSPRDRGVRQGGSGGMESPRAGQQRRPPGRTLLLTAAEELFGERSYHRTTVADICARAGMATGSFYSYFESKAEIFAAVVRAINDDVRQAMREALERTEGGQRALERASFRAYFDMLSQRPWIDRIVRESEFIDPALFREYYELLTRGYARGVRAAQLAREVDAHYDPEVIAFAYTGIGNFVGMRWADWTAGGRVPDDVLDDVLELLTRGLPPRDPALTHWCGQPCGRRVDEAVCLGKARCSAERRGRQVGGVRRGPVERPRAEGGELG